MYRTLPHASPCLETEGANDNAMHASFNVACATGRHHLAPALAIERGRRRTRGLRTRTPSGRSCAVSPSTLPIKTCSGAHCMTVAPVFFARPTVLCNMGLSNPEKQTPTRERWRVCGPCLGAQALQCYRDVRASLCQRESFRADSREKGCRGATPRPGRNSESLDILDGRPMLRPAPGGGWALQGHLRQHAHERYAAEASENQASGAARRSATRARDARAPILPSPQCGVKSQESAHGRRLQSPFADIRPSGSMSLRPKPARRGRT